MAEPARALVRCMGGGFCRHTPGTCTATAGAGGLGPRVDDRHRPTVHGTPPTGRVAVVLKWLFEVGNVPKHTAWPADAQVVHVAPDADPAHAGRVWVWTLHTQPDDSTGPQIRYRWIRLFGTGEPIPVPCAHLGTAVTPSGLVWHLVEVL